jgi:hypothetical protein
LSLARFWVEVTPKVDPAKAKRQLESDMSKVDTSTAGKKAGARFAGAFGVSIKGLRTVIAGVVSARALTGLANLAGEASDLNETISKSQNIFGKNAKAIENWANTAANSMGISKQAALDGAAAFGNFFDQIGIGGKESVKMSKGLVQLSSDLASFNNADPAQVMEAFQSATRGEYDSLQAFIPTVNAATVQTEALRITHKKSVKDLTEADKATALYALAQRDAGKAAGDFGRTSDGLANQQRKLKANVANLRTQIGAALLPAFQQMAKVLNDQVIPPVAAFVSKHAPALRNAIAQIVPAALQIFAVLSNSNKPIKGPFEEEGPFLGVLFKIRRAFDDLAPTVRGFFASLKAQGAGGSLKSMAGSLEDLLPLVRQFVEQAHGVGPALNLAATVLKFFADNADTVAKFMPLLVAGFIAYKVAVLAANVATAATFPVKVAEVVVNRQLVKSNQALIASRVGLTGATAASTAVEATNTAVKATGTAVTGKATIFTKALTLATKAWGIAVKVALGPVGWIILAIGLAVTAIIALYKNNETARKIIDAAWAWIKKAIAAAWTFIKPLLVNFGKFLKMLWENALQGQRRINDAFAKIGSAIKSVWERVIRPAIRTWLITWLTIVGGIVTGAAKALGWVPGVGPQLRKAERAFQSFKDGVNRALGGIKDQQVGIGAKITFPRDWQNYRAGERMAVGGPVRGPGSGTSDSIPAMLSNGEHVWTAKEVHAAGGHAAMETMRKSVVRGFARGGAVGFDLLTRMPGADRIGQLSSAVTNVFEQSAISFARKLQKEFSFGGSALAFAQGQRGKPYIWGGVGPAGYDCSGFMSAILNVIQGRSPYSRRGTTGTFPWPGFARGDGRFMIGSRRGAPGHMAGTLAGVNVESRGSAGVVVGPGARGARSSLFGGNVWHLKGFARGGRVGDAPFDILNPRGKDFVGQDFWREVFGDRPHYAFANGGVLTEPIFGIGRSGRTYSLAENGVETVTPGRGGATFVNNGVVTTPDVENWFVGVQRSVKRKGRS